MGRIVLHIFRKGIYIVLHILIAKHKLRLLYLTDS